MKFADKYEILEMVTSGRVSTFLARERTSQEAVVVYTFECKGSGAADLSTASIISRFCSLAPNPPGIIVKAGFDEPSSSAFITTKMPDVVALKAWVGAYHSFAVSDAAPMATPPPAPRPASNPAMDATAELSSAEMRAMMARSGSAPKQPPVENLSENMGDVTAAFSLDIPAPAGQKPSGDFTRLFQEANAFQPTPNLKPRTAPVPTKPAATSPTDALFSELLGGSPLGGKATPSTRSPAPPQSTPAPVEPSPGAFTREFLGIPDEKSAPSVAGREMPPRSVAPTEKEPGAFTREFMGISPQNFPSSNPVKPVQPPKNTGPQFTPPAPPQPVQPQATSFDSIFGPTSPSSGGSSTDNQKAGAGEFTSFFRNPFESPGASKPIEVPDVASSSPTKPPAGDFTRMFGRDEIAGAKSAPPPPAFEPEPQPSAGSFTQMFGEPPSAKKTQGSQLGEAMLRTNPGAGPSFMEPSGVPQTPTPAQPTIDPFFSRTPASVTPNPSFMNPGMSSPSMNVPGSATPGSTTDVFRMPGSEAPPPMEQPPGGPSEFTVFLSRSQLSASLPPEMGGTAAPPPTPAPAFTPPPAPNPFQFAPPTPPPPPSVKMPAAPKPPTFATPAVTAPKPTSFWPLIVVLTVLLAIGALMVMYFALKH